MELIKIALGDYPRYEELLLRKDKFEKEALYWYEEYIRAQRDSTFLVTH